MQNYDYNSDTTIIGSPLYHGTPLYRSATVRINRPTARKNDGDDSDETSAKAAGPLKKRCNDANRKPRSQLYEDVERERMHLAVVSSFDSGGISEATSQT